MLSGHLDLLPLVRHPCGTPNDLALCRWGPSAALISVLVVHRRLSVNTLRYWRSYGVGPICCRLGKHLRYRVGDVLAWVEEHRGE